MARSNTSNLWLADALWKLGAVEFGSFTLGRTTVDSPVYINVRKLIAHPAALWRAAQVIQEEITALQAMRNPHVAPFQLVAGVPLGGLHIATAYSLVTKMPLIYLHPTREGNVIEGAYKPNQTAFILDDLVTGGGSILETADRLLEAGLFVKNAFALIDRQQGARERLRRHGINLNCALTLEVLLNHLMANRRITEDWYRKSLDFLERSGSEQDNPD